MNPKRPKSADRPAPAGERDARAPAAGPVPAAPRAGVRPGRVRAAAPAPARLRATTESLDRHVGAKIREHRQRNRLTISDVALLANLSVGMLSKIETGQASASLESLVNIANALGVPFTSLFRDYDAPGGVARLVRAGEGMEVVRKGTAKGHTYRLLSYDQGPQKLFEPFLITMDDASEEFPSFEHRGTEFIYMLQGKLEYRHGRTTYLLGPGDALTFSGDVPHGPARILEVPIRFVTVIMYGARDG
ncbi:MAG: helix-turn-helix domain-containing protein [Lautropia sp.]